MSKPINFKNDSLLYTALTHRSYLNENPKVSEDNERLEFLGDAVLNFLSGEFVYKHYPNLSEGKLTPLRSSLIEEKQLAEFARNIRIGDKMLRDAMLLGRGAILEGGRQNPSLLSSTFEALIGAYYLDSGFKTEPVRAFVEPLFASVVKNIVVTDSVVFAQSNVDYKSLFQQMALAAIIRNPQRQNPQYMTTRSGGTDDAPQFTAKVYVNNKLWGVGKGRSKKDAEKCAAEDAIARWKDS